jgi:hypothetical protein
MFANPKQWSDRRTNQAFYGYYAGFSRSFVRDAIPRMSIDPGATLLDPWNGAGTSTEAGAAAGLRVQGFDINPVMVLVAKGRLLTTTVVPSIDPICSDIVRKAANFCQDSTEGEPLQLWLSRGSAMAVRAIERSIHNLLVESGSDHFLAGLETLSGVSSLAAFYYTALFKTLRLILAPLRGSNPTWFKQNDNRPLLQVEAEKIRAMFVCEVKKLVECLDIEVLGRGRIVANLDVASSTSVPLSDHSVDAVIASPPYCTRIDYAVATLPELFIIGANQAKVRSLRDAMIGSPTVSSVTLGSSRNWGGTCAEFLERVRTHSSKASSGYYLKGFCSYFEKMDGSLSQLARTLRSSAPMILVVQNSFYKNIPNDLAAVLSEIAQGKGFELEHREDFVLGTSLRSINTRSRAYHRQCSVIESVLMFRRARR